MDALQKEPPGTPEAPSGMKQQVRRIVLGQLVLQGLLALVALGAGAVPLGVFLGVLAGLEDTLLVLWGILSGMGKPPRQAALSMHCLMFLRIGVLLVWTVAALKLQCQPVLVLLSFVCLNAGLVMQMVRCHLGDKKQQP
ncbi:hypothetical protein [Acidaminococcus timonensis]|uniref:hypothetical protein n=1 Tax=Acidaminococcus timonensis TaxID=1871002 RepID=UPI002942A18C|nr:hypothetical protein [Acidaminococcus timonensis]